MNRYLANLTVLIGLLLTSACLQQETTHTLYLSPDGAVGWMSIERDIRSDARDPAERLREEQGVLDRLAEGTHPNALALRQLGGDSIQVRLLRPERPYAVMTEARFPSIELVFQRLFDELQIPYSATLVREGAFTTLALGVRTPGSESLSLPETPVTALVDSDAPYRIVLTEGRFVSAVGFSLAADGVIAILDENAFEEAGEPDAPVRTLSLTWRSR
jgi:hypothetical protein